MKKKLILLLVVLLVLVGLGGVWYFKIYKNVANKTPAVGKQIPQKEIPVLVYTDSGFLPVETTIKAGQTVRFLNRSKKEMWIASNPHPTHTDYPEFNQMQAGPAFDFVFYKSGTWKFHNHLDPISGGQVIVTE